jgi:hypothetical protein
MSLVTEPELLNISSQKMIVFYIGYPCQVNICETPIGLRQLHAPFEKLHENNCMLYVNYPTMFCLL